MSHQFQLTEEKTQQKYNQIKRDLVLFPSSLIKCLILKQIYPNREHTLINTHIMIDHDTLVPNTIQLA